MVFLGCTPGELRALTRLSETPPPLGERPGECWLVDGGAVRRAHLALDERFRSVRDPRPRKP
jgi:hypothetical protein